MRIKSCNVAVKAAGEQDGTDDGVFEAIVATWDLDSYGDKIVQGAFADTLKEWKAKGDPIPVIWSHMSYDPEMHIGVVEEAEERDEGLWVRGRLDLETTKAAQVYRLLKGRRVTQFSFAFDVLDGGFVEKKAEGEGENLKDESFYELRKLKLYEVGPCLVGVNQETELLAVKAAGRELRIDVHGKHSPDESAAIRTAVEAALNAKAGRVLSAKNETTLREAADQIEAGRKAIQTVLSALDSDDGKSRTEDPPAPAGESTDGKAKPGQPATDEDPGRGKSDRPADPRSASDVRLLASLRALGAEVWQ